MAREVHQRENLLRDAKAFVRRIEFRTSDNQEVFVGFRKSGAASVYLDQDPVYHFNSSAELRRAFVADRLFKAKSGALVVMRRKRPGGEVQLVSQLLDAAATTTFLTEMRDRLAQLHQAFSQRELRLVGQVPDDQDVGPEVKAWLAKLLAGGIVIAESPHAV